MCLRIRWLVHNRLVHEAGSRRAVGPAIGPTDGPTNSYPYSKASSPHSERAADSGLLASNHIHQDHELIDISVLIVRPRRKERNEKTE
jgi:hypothetical protein